VTQDLHRKATAIQALLRQFPEFDASRELPENALKRTPFHYHRKG
jgi:hypothetical protein